MSKEPKLKTVKRRSMGQEALNRLLRNRTAMFGLAILLLVIILWYSLLRVVTMTSLLEYLLVIIPSVESFLSWIKDGTMLWL